MHNDEFKSANKVFSGNLHDQEEKGLDKSRSYPPVLKKHLQEIYDNYIIPHFDNDPKCLQHKVFFEIAFFLGKEVRKA